MWRDFGGERQDAVRFGDAGGPGDGAAALVVVEWRNC